MSDLVSIGSTINSISESVTGITSMFESIYSKIESIQKKKLSTSNLLKAYYLEVVNNIELLHVVKFDVFKKEKPNSLIVKSIVDKIEIQLGAALLFQENINEKTDLYKFLEDKGKINNKDQKIIQIINGKEKVNKQKSFYENVLQAVSFTVVKTEVLRKLTLFSDEDLKILNNLQIDVRLQNILERFIMIKDKLDSLKVIQTIAR